MSSSKTIVIKVGTNVLSNTDGSLDLSVISSIVDQIATLKKDGHKVILVSSGAVGAGKDILELRNGETEVVKKQVYSALGQVKLMGIYADYFSKHNLHCAQVLATRDDFLGTEHYRNMQNCFMGLLHEDIIPIVNENDVISIKELMFTDNDELSGLTAFMIKADLLFLLTNVDGMYTGNPTEASSKLIPEVKIGINDNEVEDYILTAKSSAGRGGMRSKFDTAKRCAEKGIITFMANGKKENIVLGLLEDKEEGTVFR